ncbi:MAG: lysophospholipid acyltransferase family protein [Deltaproteobacteria bacterium]|nr:lysophospholipid acyltransferase family protein [Deltaproteobacteria bacterium]
MPDPAPSSDSLRFDSAFWRKLAWQGAAYGPRWWVEGSPPLIGLVFAALMRRHRAMVRRNLRTLLGTRSRLVEDADVVRTFMSFAQALADGLALSAGDRFRSDVSVSGAEHVRSAIDVDRGLIVATAHTAGWETALAALKQNLNRPVLVVMRAEPDKKAGALHDGYRQNLGFEVLHAGGDPLSSLPLIRHLRQGGIVAVQIDRCTDGMRGQDVTLGSRPFRVPRGPFVLASMTGAPIVPVFSMRTGFLAYRIEAGEPVHIARRTDEAALGASIQRVVAALESFLRRNPTQWFHFVDGP